MIHATLLFVSGMDLTMILGVALLLFGGKKLPELAKGLGTGIKEFKDATAGITNPPVNAPIEVKPELVKAEEVHG